MALSELQMRKLNRMAAKDLLEVEHLLKVARIGDSSDVQFLQSLKTTNSWSDSGIENGVLVVPFGRWTEVVCAFLEGGYDRLISLATDPDTFDDYCEFCIAALEELRTPQSVLALMDIAQGIETIPTRHKAVSVAAKIASALNLILSLKGAPSIYPHIEDTVREFLHTLLIADLEEHELASVIYALRGVGDELSIHKITALPPLNYPFEGAQKASIRAIKKRVKQRRDA